MVIKTAKDYYKILEIDKTATKEEIKRAFRKLARQYHPDVNPDDPDAEQKFKEINEAYMILSDDKKREMYDKFGVVDGDPSAWQQAGAGAGSGPGGGRVYQGPDGTTYYYSTGGGGGGFDFSEIFGNATRGGGRGRSTGGRGGFDFFNDLGDIFDVFSNQGGSTRGWSGRQNVPREGEDLRYDLDIDFMTAFNGGDMRLQYRDPSSGEQKSMTVKIPAGVKSEQKLRLKGKGMPGVNGGPPGDLYIAIHIKEHPGFQRNEDDDLLVTEEIPYTTAVLGGKISVQGVDRVLSVTIPKGTKDSTVLRLRGQGFTKLRSGGRGNLLIEIKVQVPATVTKEQEKLLEQLKTTGL